MILIYFATLATCLHFSLENNLVQRQQQQILYTIFVFNYAIYIYMYLNLFILLYLSNKLESVWMLRNDNKYCVYLFIYLISF